MCRGRRARHRKLLTEAGGREADRAVWMHTDETGAVRRKRKLQLAHERQLGLQTTRVSQLKPEGKDSLLPTSE